MNCAVAYKPWSELMAALDAHLAGRDFTGEEFYTEWAREVARHLCELHPGFALEYKAVLVAAAAAFNDISSSDNMIYLLADLLEQPNKFARTLLLMTGTKSLHPWQRLSVPNVVQ
ncbi:hypothetical protein [Desulforhopalus singaporensis]|uniref:Uncharacterized protein n=1 Tax=Desulforhopalus singaporensis TaxID=91360 RepID=A0A1H0RM07_9BACT|nr:hypothetical protein [Desulforhopalus singaporensis]SDP30349.1 hypothetical protein SAMN05660330_02361 [Desulforhopalus singaporensis]